METTQLAVETADPAATQHLGRLLARLLPGPAVITLAGDLGAGKTTFVQGLGQGLGVTKAITSPTFVLINRYRCADGRYLQHADCYRLQNAPLEMWDVGLADLLWGEDIVVVEWADRVPGLLPDEHLQITFTYLAGNRRGLVFTGHGCTYGHVVNDLAALTEGVTGVTRQN